MARVATATPPRSHLVRVTCSVGTACAVLCVCAVSSHAQLNGLFSSGVATTVVYIQAYQLTEWSLICLVSAFLLSCLAWHDQGVVHAYLGPVAVMANTLDLLIQVYTVPTNWQYSTSRFTRFTVPVLTSHASMP